MNSVFVGVGLNSVRMSTPARKRLMRDFKRLQQDPPAGISGAPYDNNIMLWNAVIFGPDETPWDGGKMAQLSAENAAQLQEGISLLLSRWSALQMAVENEWGGRDSLLKSQQLAADILSWFTLSKEPLYIDDLENMLDEFMLSLNTEIADGSIEEIVEKLMIMHEECLEGNYKSIQILKEAMPPRGAIPHIGQAASDDNDNDDDDDGSVEDNDSSEMVNDPPESQPNGNHKDMAVGEQRANGAVEADDGWTVVSSRRRNRARRN